MSCLLNSLTTLKQCSSTCKDFYNYKFFAFLFYTPYISSLQINEANSSLLYIPNTNLFFRFIFSSSFIDFKIAFRSLDIASKEGTSPWLGMSRIKVI